LELTRKFPRLRNKRIGEEEASKSEFPKIERLCSLTEEKARPELPGNDTITPPFILAVNLEKESLSSSPIDHTSPTGSNLCAPQTKAKLVPLNSILLILFLFFFLL